MAPVTEARAAILVAHGSPAAPQGPQRAVVRLAADVAERLPGWSLRGATLATPAALADALAKLRGRRPAIFPLFMSDGWFVRVRLPELVAKICGDGFMLLGDAAGLIEQDTIGLRDRTIGLPGLNSLRPSLHTPDSARPAEPDGVYGHVERVDIGHVFALQADLHLALGHAHQSLLAQSEHRRAIGGDRSHSGHRALRAEGPPSRVCRRIVLGRSDQQRRGK